MEENNERIVVMFALRYSLGRKTYAFSLVRSYIIDKLSIFKKWELELMSEEVRDASAYCDLSEWEKKEYVNFADRLLEEADKIVGR